MSTFEIIFTSIIISILCSILITSICFYIVDKRIAKFKKEIIELKDWSVDVAKTYNEHVVEFHN